MKKVSKFVGSTGYYTRCCGKPVNYNFKEVSDNRGGKKEEKQPGYHCSRCKKPVTVYGNPVGVDRDVIREEQKVKGRGHKVLSNGDLQLIDILYKKTNETENTGHYCNKYVVFDNKGNYMTAIKIEHTNGGMYEVLKPFENRLIKENLCGHDLRSFSSMGLGVKELQNPSLFRECLKNLGYKFNTNGFIR